MGATQQEAEEWGLSELIPKRSRPGLTSTELFVSKEEFDWNKSKWTKVETVPS